MQTQEDFRALILLLIPATSQKGNGESFRYYRKHSDFARTVQVNVNNPLGRSVVAHQTVSLLYIPPGGAWPVG
ncbi:hypothetical protein F5146DRAFT_53813 [Armillaria mellea]|nr:hypothetical protein F5146DRAFT_53813 [Armillaria mellea]